MRESEYMNYIYHLAPAVRWREWPADRPYLPAEYAADGFVHCTAGDDLMVQVANRYYRAAPGDFVLLVIDPSRLTSEVRWEDSGDELAPQFPHVYGPIDRAAIVVMRQMRRAESGEFIGW